MGDTNKKASISQNKEVVADLEDRNWIIWIISIAVFMLATDYGIFNILLPKIAMDFNITIGMAARFPLYYYLIIIGCISGFAWLGDKKGPHNIFFQGIGIFIAGAVISAVSGIISNGYVLLVGRIIQGMGVAMISPTGVAIMMRSLPSDRKDELLGFVGVAFGLGLVIGPVLGGVFISTLSWYWAFAISVLLGILVYHLGKGKLPELEKKEDIPSFDFPGSILLFLSIGALIFSLNMGQKLG